MTNAASSDPLLNDIEAKENRKRRLVHGFLESRVRMAKEYMTTFADSVKENPWYAMEWADKAFEKAADLKISEACFRQLTDEKHAVTLQSIFQFCMERTVNGAKNVARSTSTASNLMHQYSTSAAAEIAEFLGKIIDLND